jgi:predicted dienelactone hydrolase
MRYSARPCLLVFLCVLLLACGDDPVLPVVEPLTADEADIRQLYGATPGPLEVAVVRDIALPDAGEERELTVNLYFPAQGSDFPLLLFSHGNWSDKDSYDRIIEHWVSHGYTVVAANHLDCCGAVNGIYNSVRHGQVGLVEARISDLSRVLDKLPMLEQRVPAFAGKADTSTLAITGHSFGAFTAQQLGGARVFDPDKESFLSHQRSDIRAVVALSPPGPMFDTITDQSWTTLQAPTLVTTGTWDVQPRFWPDWRMHLMSWETAIPGDKYALITQGADHYLGNLICRLQREAKPQEDALRMMQIASTTFLDAYVKGEQQAAAFLESGKLQSVTSGFSRLESR